MTEVVVTTLCAYRVHCRQKEKEWDPTDRSGFCFTVHGEAAVLSVRRKKGGAGWSRGGLLYLCDWPCSR